MVENQSNAREAMAKFHEDIPHRFQVSLTMSMDVRDDVRAIRDDLKEESGSRDVTTNDVIRLALLAASRYHTVASADGSELEEVDRDLLVPLTAAMNRHVDSTRPLERAGESSE